MSPSTNSAEYEILIPPGTPAWITSSLIALTLKTWQKFSKAVLTVEDAVTMILNVSQLQRVLRGA